MLDKVRTLINDTHVIHSIGYKDSLYTLICSRKFNLGGEPTVDMLVYDLSAQLVSTTVFGSEHILTNLQDAYDHKKS